MITALTDEERAAAIDSLIDWDYDEARDVTMAHAIDALLD